MINKYRELFNEGFSQEKYHNLLDDISNKAGQKPDFRISESPIFLPKTFKSQLDSTCESIIRQIKAFSSADLTKAVPSQYLVANDVEKPHFIAIDFGICQDDNGNILPQLIELQGFPSIFAYQKELEESLIEIYPFCKELTETKSKAEYISLLRNVIVGEENPENVILLEIYPERQKTKIDFIFTERFLGIKTVCLTKLIKEGKKLYYEESGKKVRIKRIYNRVIFEELKNIPDLKTGFEFVQDADVKWVTHPNWFFKISKHLLPKLKHEFVPKSYFLNDFPDHESLEEFVLKPLYSFGGNGVNLEPTKDILANLTDKEDYILQRKVNYAPIFRDINGEHSKAEIRMLFIWKEKEENPELAINLVRMTKENMMNLGFNKKDAIWVGSSIVFFEK